jgi:hypothetical protein
VVGLAGPVPGWVVGRAGLVPGAVAGLAGLVPGSACGLAGLVSGMAGKAGIASGIAGAVPGIGDGARFCVTYATTRPSSPVIESSLARNSATSRWAASRIASAWPLAC